MSKYVQLVFIINKKGLAGKDTLGIIRNEIAKSKKANCKNKIELFKNVKSYRYIENKTYGSYSSAFNAIFEKEIAEHGEMVILPYFDNDKYSQLAKYKKLTNKIAVAEKAVAAETDKKCIQKAITKFSAAVEELELFEKQSFESDKFTIWLAACWVKVSDNFKPKGRYMYDIYKYINK